MQSASQFVRYENSTEHRAWCSLLFESLYVYHRIYNTRNTSVSWIVNDNHSWKLKAVKVVGSYDIISNYIVTDTPVEVAHFKGPYFVGAAGSDLYRCPLTHIWPLPRYLGPLKWTRTVVGGRECRYNGRLQRHGIWNKAQNNDTVATL